MQIQQKKLILTSIARLQHEIDELEDVVMQLCGNPYSSASMSSGSGSKSYTYKDVTKLQETIKRKHVQINNLRAKLGGVASSMPTKIIQTFY